MIMALGIGVFLVDAQSCPGGVSGLAMAIQYLSGNTISVGLLILGFKYTFIYLGIKRKLGKQFGLRTFVGFSCNHFHRFYSAAIFPVLVLSVFRIRKQ
jgi:uncharacterized membrane-anchored protein YitT (DUF2179 family)